MKILGAEWNNCPLRRVPRVPTPLKLSLGDSFSTLPLGFSTVAFTLSPVPSGGPLYDHTDLWGFNPTLLRRQFSLLPFVFATVFFTLLTHSIFSICLTYCGYIKTSVNMTLGDPCDHFHLKSLVHKTCLCGYSSCVS